MTASTVFGNLQKIRNANVATRFTDLVHILKGGVTAVTIGAAETFLEVNVAGKLVRGAVFILKILVTGPAVVCLGHSGRENGEETQEAKA
jgi:hypothetical protein